jgi:hypothetical protein
MVPLALVLNHTQEQAPARGGVMSVPIAASSPALYVYEQSNREVALMSKGQQPCCGKKQRVHGLLRLLLPHAKVTSRLQAHSVS